MSMEIAAALFDVITTGAIKILLIVLLIKLIMYF